MRKDRERTGREWTRDVLRRADGTAQPQEKRLVEQASAWVAEAQQRRRLPDRLGLLDATAALAGRTLPRLAVATGLVLALATALFLTEDSLPQTTATGGSDLDRLILSGTAGDEADDPLLDALLSEEDGNG